MPRPFKIMDEFVGPGRPIRTDTLAEAARVSERTALTWREEDETREPSFSDLARICESTLIPLPFKLALLNEMLRRCTDVKVVACGGAAHEDAPPLTLTIDADATLIDLQRLVNDAQCPRGPGGEKFTANEANEVATVRARFEILMTRLWAAIERRTLRKQTG